MIENNARPFMGFNKLIKRAYEEHNVSSSTNDLSLSRQILISDSYYSLINGYQRALEKNDNSEIFKDGITLQQLDLLYFLENNLSATLFQNILFIEKRFKTAMQYVISKHLGTLADEEYLYFNPKYYVRDGNTYSTLKKLRNTSSGFYNTFDTTTQRWIRGDRIPRNRDHVSKGLKEHRITGNVPPWVLVNDLTFGMILNWYKSLKNNLQIEIIFLAFPNINFITSSGNKDFDSNLSFANSALTIMKDFRNSIAHGDLLNKINFSISLSWNHLRRLLNLSGVLTCNEFNSGIGKKDIFSIYLLIIILSDERQKTLLFPNTKVILFQAYDSLGNSLTKDINKVFNIPDNFLSRIDNIHLKNDKLSF